MKHVLAALLALLVTTGAAGATEVIARHGDGCDQGVGLLADHPPLNATLAAIGAAFGAGADRVEVDMTVTADGQIAISYGAACRGTLGLREMLTAVPDGHFILDLGGGLRGAGDTMVAFLKAAKAGGLLRPGQVMVYSSSDTVMNQQAAGALPELAAPGLDMQNAEECLTEYSQRGVFPRVCQGAEIPLPVAALRNMGDYAADVITAIHAAHARAHVLGVESADDYKRAAAFSPDFIWTDRIKALGL